MKTGQDKLIARYRKLDATCQGVVQVLAVYEQPIRRIELIELVKNTGVGDAVGLKLGSTKFSKELKTILAAEIATYVRGANGPIEVNPLLLDFVVQSVFVDGRLESLSKSLHSPANYPPFYTGARSLARMRAAFYLGEVDVWKQLESRCEFTPRVLNPLDVSVFQRLNGELQALFLNELVVRLVACEQRVKPKALSELTQVVESQPELISQSIDSLRDLYICQGDIDGLQRITLADESAAIQASISFMQGDYEASREQFEVALKSRRKRTKQRGEIFPFLPSIFYVLLLLREKSTKSLKLAVTTLNKINRWENALSEFAPPVLAAIKRLTNPHRAGYEAYFDFSSSARCLSEAWCWRWFAAEEPTPLDTADLMQIGDFYRETGLLWIAAEFDVLTAKVSESKSPKTGGKRTAAFSKSLIDSSEETHQRLGTVSLVDFIRPLPKWEAMLCAVENLVIEGPASGTGGESGQPQHDERMIWEFDFSAYDDSLRLVPYVQKRSRKGWTKGRKVSLARLYDTQSHDDFTYLSEQDRAICAAIRETVGTNYYGYRETSYEWDTGRLAKHVIGHPNLYRPKDRTTPIEVTEATPGLTIKRSGKNIRLAVTPETEGSSVVIQDEGANRVSIVRFDSKQTQLAGMVSALPPIPATQSDRVAAIARSVSSIIAVQSELDGGSPVGEAKSSDSRIAVQLTPYQDGLRAELFVQPLGEQGPCCRPGLGAAAVFATVEGQQVSTKRGLKLERRNLDVLLASCAPLEARTVSDQQSEWLFENAEDALELVTDLQGFADKGKLTVLWPRGKTHDVAGRASSSQFRVAIKKDRDWFAASGKLKVDSKLTLDMMELIELSSASSSRFVRLDDGRYLALTAELRNRIAEMSAFGTAAKGKVRFAPIRALAMEDFIESTTAKTDKHWKEHINRIEESAKLKTSPPSTLQAELRDYQQDGFAWMKRLAHWNTGACLADDMGLGKTIQALALLVDRAAKGPSLVVAPASVGFNWENEAFKFAPTLNAKLFRDCDREEFFQELGPNDLAIASYGLVQSEIDRFAEVEWNTVLLDEAQAIKNMETKRSQAVMRLQADFRLILTGTPLENHLGEMWNLFRFVTPGLLGSIEEFRKRYSGPIERDQCRESRNRLKKLIQPFLLRRTKTEVLAELPPRSESLLEIEMSSAEIALYESLRLKALEKIEAATNDTSKKGQQHLQVLAELTRLRLACCHPSLVGGGDLKGSKLEMFRYKITEIVEGGHKVLVFSQFVKHLAILREELDKLGVSHQYLDGSTSAKKRKEKVEGFQAGEGDVFLISLKAGGTGLNLTAADYVIHMDPWWNPAVEDQATDRAHRIGQSRPVNVYRFITKGTIEEKIVALHDSKRDLADSLLSGSDVASKLSTADLIKLLKET